MRATFWITLRKPSQKTISNCPVPTSSIEFGQFQIVPLLFSDPCSRCSTMDGSREQAIFRSCLWTRESSIQPAHLLLPILSISILRTSSNLRLKVAATRLRQLSAYSEVLLGSTHTK